MPEKFYEISEGRLVIGGSIIETPDTIRRDLQVDDKVIVLTNWRYENNSRNVFCFDGSGSLVWTIKESPYGPEPKRPYTGLTVDKDGRPIVGQMSGFDYLLDPETGHVEVIAFSR